MQHHRMSFFGQKTGMILDSADQADSYLFLRFLKKKPDGTWEKISEKEGKNIKINLLELIAIRDVLERPNLKWSTVHKFQNDTTQISLENQGEIVNISISGYSKQIKYPETTLLLTLLNHILEEKIMYATSGEKNSFLHGDKSQPPGRINAPAEKEDAIEQEIEENYQDKEEFEPVSLVPKEEPSIKNSNKFSPPKNSSPIKKENESPNFTLLAGKVISRTEKAVSFQLKDENKIWIPISVIENINEAEKLGGVNVKEWFYRKINLTNAPLIN